MAPSGRSSVLTSFCVVAVRGVVARTEALPMMHHHSGEVVEEVLWARRARRAGAAGSGEGLSAAVRLHVENLVEAHVDADLLSVVPPRPPEGRTQDGTPLSQTLKRNLNTVDFAGTKSNLIQLRCISDFNLEALDRKYKSKVEQMFCS